MEHIGKHWPSHKEYESGIFVKEKKLQVKEAGSVSWTKSTQEGRERIENKGYQDKKWKYKKKTIRTQPDIGQ
eukprot:11390533-Heterocapsa_arctica.AAC.1